MKNLYRSLKPVRVIDADEHAADDTAVVGVEVDCQGFEVLLLIFCLGDLLDAGASWAVTIAEDNVTGMGTATAVADDQLEPDESITSWVHTDDNSVRVIQVRPTKRFVQVTVTPTGNGTAWDMGCVGLLGFAAAQPQTAQAD